MTSWMWASTSIGHLQKLFWAHDRPRRHGWVSCSAFAPPDMCGPV